MSFSKLVEDTVIKHEISYIDAVLSVCEKEGLEPDAIVSLLSPPIKEKLEIEGCEINLVKRKTPRLNFL